MWWRRPIACVGLRVLFSVKGKSFEGSSINTRPRLLGEGDVCDLLLTSVLKFLAQTEKHWC